VILSNINLIKLFRKWETEGKTIPGNMTLLEQWARAHITKEIAP
jgi:hypothetical protein